MKWIKLGSAGTDVEKWQNFLCGFFPRARLEIISDGDFGPVTLKYTQEFQKLVGIKADGIVGNQTLGTAARYGFPLIDDNEAIDVFGPSWPQKPDDAKNLTDEEREKLFGKFDFKSAPTDLNPEGIIIDQNWIKENITTINIPQLNNVGNCPKGCNVKIHKAFADQFIKFWITLENEHLLSRVLIWNGSFVPRFIRGSRTRLSNHSWGTAFDINVQWNPLGAQPALRGETGSVREIVHIGYDHGMFWGGHYKNRPDGMHFEAMKIL